MFRDLIRIEGHRLGPRLHVLGRRIHEWHLGALLAVGATAMVLAHVAESISATAAAVAMWLIVKDWRDLHPRTRDTAAWSVGLHRPPSMGHRRPSDRMPLLAGAVTAIIGAINVISAATPSLPGRVQTLAGLLPGGEVQVAHALALPVGSALIASAWPLARRRRGALLLAVALLTALGALNLIKGLDVLEATITWILAIALWRGRHAFWVQHDAGTVVRATRRALFRAAGAVLLGCICVAAAAGHVVGGIAAAAVPTATLQLLTMSRGPHFAAPFAWLPTALGATGVAVLLWSVRSMFAPLRLAVVDGPLDRHRAAALIRRHGTDTLSAFKLRSDLARYWSPEGDGFAAYRVESGTFLLAGDPVAAPAAIPRMVDDLQAHARAHGLHLAAVGASDAFAQAARERGMHSLYLGDEAILTTGEMALGGGARKTLRKAVNRVARHGFSATLSRVDELDEPTLRQMTAVSDRWLDGAPERGFSMTHDALIDELLPDALVVLARDADGNVRGFLHFLPVFGRPAVSLGFMRRDRDTPNGLNDFLVVEAARLLQQHGLGEFSLNFAAFGRWLRSPTNAAERLAAHGMRIADRWFQIERLLHFNAKFDPRWQARHLVFERYSALPRVALAAMWAEGQLPRPEHPLRPGRTRVPALTAPRA